MSLFVRLLSFCVCFLARLEIVSRWSGSPPFGFLGYRRKIAGWAKSSLYVRLSEWTENSYQY
eukprot:scaffold4442_cov125-Amphora_coffeaeformis.AAC.35